MLSKFYPQLEKVHNRNSDWGRYKLAQAVGCSEKVARNFLRKKRDGIAQVIEDSATQHSDLASQVFYWKERASYWEKTSTKLNKHNALEDRILDMFQDNLREIGSLKPLSPVQMKRQGRGRAEELVVNISDIHGGEEVTPDDVLGMNAYNMEIMEQRLLKVRDALLSIQRKMSGYTFQKLNVFVLGDLVSGIIHDELIQNTPIVDQVIIIGQILGTIIRDWAAYFPEVEISGVVGNHGRVTKKPYYHKKYNNFDYLVMHFAELWCKNIPNVTFNIPKSPMMIKQIFDWNFLLTHGDGIRGSMGIPFYGIRRMDGTISQTMVVGKDLYPHYIVMGHFHNNNELAKVGGKIIINGSLKGTDPFALNAMHIGGHPQQKIFSVHPEHGVTFSMDIDLK